MSVVVSGYVPVTNELLADAEHLLITETLARDILRGMTADLFHEAWSSPDYELRWLENAGRVPVFDPFFYDDDEDEW